MPAKRTTTGRRPNANVPAAIDLSAEALLDPADDSPADQLDTEELTNGDLARIFHEIGDILEVKGELVFKTVAYHRAADALAHSPLDVPETYRRGRPPKIQGVGQAISDKIAELVSTGRMSYYDKLRMEVPPTLVEMLRIPGLGPRTVRLIHEQLGIATVDDLKMARPLTSLVSKE